MNLLTRTIAAAAGLVVVAGITSAQADTAWSLSNVTFTDNTAVTGWFVTGATGNLMQYHFVTQDGLTYDNVPITGKTYDYTSVNGGYVINSDSSFAAIHSNTSGPIDALSFQFVLTLATPPADGRNPIDTLAANSFEADYTLPTDGVQLRLFAGGAAVLATVPEPASMALFSAALLGLAGFRRFRG